MERILRGERSIRYETVHSKKDGTPLDISLAVSPINDESGNVIGASKIARDVTERVRRDRRRATQYTVTNLLAGSWTLAEVATQILEAIASSGRLGLCRNFGFMKEQPADCGVDTCGMSRRNE